MIARLLRTWRSRSRVPGGHQVGLACSVECLGLPARVNAVVREAAGTAPLGSTVGAVVLLVDQGFVGALGLSARDAGRLVSAVEALGLDADVLHLRGHTLTEACPVACLRLSAEARQAVTEAGVRRAEFEEYRTRRPALRQVGTVGEVRKLLAAGLVAAGPAEVAELRTAVHTAGSRGGG